MPNEFVLASAGAGKTTTIIEQSLEDVRLGRIVLLLTYTRNNQAEILKRIRDIHGFVPEEIRVKGWFTFLLEDLIRPYQRYIFSERISDIHFNTSDPHKRNGRTLPGRSEQTDTTRYYLANGKAHTTYISKLATRICDHGKTGRGRTATYAPIERLASIYDSVVIDEVQDLVGWDYSVLKRILSNQDISLHCVGDFRQTIYQTSHAIKDPRTSDQKRSWFAAIGFNLQNLNYSHRCIGPICAFADTVHSHQGYEPTASRAPEVPGAFADHTGVFTVSHNNVTAYIERYSPTILRVRRTVREDLCRNSRAQNFGESKGLGFDRVLIIPTENYRRYLQGDPGPIRDAPTEEAMNKLYVAITRARYSVAFLCDEESVVDNVPVWVP